MEWIREAEKKGKKQAEINTARKTAFDAELVSEEKVTAYLEVHQQPVLPIIEDLKKAGYLVEKEGPGYIYHSDSGHSNTEDEEFRRFTLTRTVAGSSYGAAYDRYSQQVFAIEWSVSRKGRDKNNHQRLGTISIYPTINEDTHYAGVIYRTQGKWPSKPHNIDDPDITTALKNDIREWIMKAQAPVIVRR